MRAAIVALLFCSVSAVPSRLINPVATSENAPAISDDLIERVNSRRTTWKAAMNPKFDGMTISQAKTYLGTILGGELPPAKLFEDEEVEAPEEFDARTQWPNCPSITLVRDQSACGSCWAFGSTEAFNDRLCVATGSKVILAAADVLSCCAFTCGMGCNGGYPQGAWNYFVSKGVVNDTCFTYPFAPCAHHVNPTPEYPACPSGEYDTPKCLKTCKDGSSFSASKIHAKSSYSIRGEQNIMKELSTLGPVTAAFSVYEDFLAYKTGVYQYTTGSELGGHAVEIVGYGVEKGVKYWTVKNSWNPSWGDNGYFKILRGSNECGIEGEITAGAAA